MAGYNTLYANYLQLQKQWADQKQAQAVDEARYQNSRDDQAFARNTQLAQMVAQQRQQDEARQVELAKLANYNAAALGKEAPRYKNELVDFVAQTQGTQGGQLARAQTFAELGLKGRDLDIKERNAARAEEQLAINAFTATDQANRGAQQLQLQEAAQSALNEYRKRKLTLEAQRNKIMQDNQAALSKMQKEVNDAQIKAIDAQLSSLNTVFQQQMTLFQNLGIEQVPLFGLDFVKQAGKQAIEGAQSTVQQTGAAAQGAQQVVRGQQTRTQETAEEAWNRIMRGQSSAPPTVTDEDVYSEE